MSKRPVWSWTDAVAASSMAPLTKFICLNIARYFSSAGKGWRVSIKEMITDTGLSNRSLATHLQLAADAKFLIIKREIGAHGQRGVTTYTPSFPDGTELAKHAELPSEGGSLGPSEPDSRGPDELGSLRPSEGGSRQVLPPESTSQDTPLPPASGGLQVPPSFEEFWNAYPKGVRSRSKKHQARRAFADILAGEHREGHKATADEIVEGAKRFAASRPDPDYVPMPVTWLNAARWLDEPEPGRTISRTSSLGRLLSRDSGPAPRDTSETWAEYSKRIGPDGKPRAASCP